MRTDKQYIKQSSKVISSEQRHSRPSFIDNRPFSIAQSGIIQGYFSRKNSTGLSHFSNTGIKLKQEQVGQLECFIKHHYPDKLSSFQANSKSKEDINIDNWLKENSISQSFDESIRLGTLCETTTKFPQIAEIPTSWISDCNAHNPGGPPIVVTPGFIPSPNTSEAEEEKVSDTSPYLCVDLREDSFTYRNQTYPISPEIKSQMRASAMLTNSYVDFARKHDIPLIGKSTESIRSKTGEERAKERKRKSYRDFYLSHHPDTFWTGKTHSEMGWHPVTNHTNTLEGDYQHLQTRAGKQLEGFALIENKGATRPTLAIYNAHPYTYIKQIDQKADWDSYLEIISDVKSQLCKTEASLQIVALMQDVIIKAKSAKERNESAILTAEDQIITSEAKFLQRLPPEESSVSSVIMHMKGTIMKKYERFIRYGFTVHVNNIDSKVSVQKDILGHFIPKMEVQSLEDKVSKKGMAFIGCKTKRDALQIVSLNDSVINGRPIKCRITDETEITLGNL